jgi:hypothetical protein
LAPEENVALILEKTMIVTGGFPSELTPALVELESGPKKMRGSENEGAKRKMRRSYDLPPLMLFTLFRPKFPGCCRKTP